MADDYTEQGHPSFVGRPNARRYSVPTLGPVEKGDPLFHDHIEVRHSHTIRSALGARVLRGQRCICGAIYEEVIGRIE